MKKLSEFKDEEAIELWADLLDPITKIFSDKNFAIMSKQKRPVLEQVKYILKNHKNEAITILNRIDPEEPIDAISVVTRTLAIFSEIGQRKELGSFFGSAEQAKPENGSSGSVTENTEDEEQ